MAEVEGRLFGTNGRITASQKEKVRKLSSMETTSDTVRLATAFSSA
jgi:hypothetical protein